MDKIRKALAKLTTKEREKIRGVLTRLNAGTLEGLDIKKLKGRDDIFRVRVGDVRVIYKAERGSIFVLAIQRRTETTYKNR